MLGSSYILIINFRTMCVPRKAPKVIQKGKVRNGFWHELHIGDTLTFTKKTGEELLMQVTGTLTESKFAEIMKYSKCKKTQSRDQDEVFCKILYPKKEGRDQFNEVILRMKRIKVIRSNL